VSHERYDGGFSFGVYEYFVFGVFDEGNGNEPECSSDALSAAWLLRLLRSTREVFGEFVLEVCTSRISLCPTTSGNGRTTCFSS
jgi:hypothetical protein